MDAGVPSRLEGAGPIQSAEARQQGNTVQITVRLRSPRDSMELAPEEGGWRVTVRAAEAPGIGGRGTVIVDAGHGGKDPGAVVKGVHEADINLAVAKLLRRELEDRGYKVLLSREEDVYKTLQERPKFASDNNGDMFISLHCNSIAGPASRLANVTGHVAYILREAESEEDKAIARRENMAIEESGKTKKTEISPLDWILLEHQLNLYSKQSESLTESIVRNFAGFDIPKSKACGR
jgi:N-acetylmuramoyl-L-alanine amidase